MKSRSWIRSPITVVVFVAFLLVAGTAAAWTMTKVDHLAHGEESMRFVVDCDYEKFRQIMVRKNASETILNRGGMALVEEDVLDVNIDASGDDRPLLNAIRGKSQSEVEAVKELTVRLTDPAIDAERLVLRQKADITAERMSVRTTSKQAAGNLESYLTTLDAEPVSGGTEVTLVVSMDVRVQVPKMFTSRADSKVQQAAVDAVAEQAESIKAFIAEHADKRLILPEL